MKKHDTQRVLNEEVLITNFLPPGKAVINVSSESYQLGLGIDS